MRKLGVAATASRSNLLDKIGRVLVGRLLGLRHGSYAPTVIGLDILFVNSIPAQAVDPAQACPGSQCSVTQSCPDESA